ncbi:MAG: hypothetical protein U9R43_13090 [Thermodesulfobacteriota bacterium]|nr:hypothetical protein [Thermodesulfobacteriota bacterium]
MSKENVLFPLFLKHCCDNLATLQLDIGVSFSYAGRKNTSCIKLDIF